MANKRTLKRWTSSEERVLINCVKHCLTLYEAFDMTAEKTGRTAKGVSQHYYKNKHVLMLDIKDSEGKAVKPSGFMAWVKNIFKF